MENQQKTVAVWYVGDGVSEPTRTFITEGAEFPETDSHGQRLFADHHFVRWSDARDQQLKTARSILRGYTDDLLEKEHQVEKGQQRVAAAAKVVLHIETLVAPNEVLDELANVQDDDILSRVASVLTERTSGYRGRDQAQARISQALKLLGHPAQYCPNSECFGYRDDHDNLAPCVNGDGLVYCSVFNRDDQIGGA